MCIRDRDTTVQILEKCLKGLTNFPDEQFSIRTSIKAYQSLANIYLTKDQPEKSLSFTNKALALQQGKKPYKLFNSYELLGRYHLYKKEFVKAEENLNKSIEKRMAHYHKFTNHRYIAVGYFELGKLYQAKGDYQRALDTYQLTLQKLTPGFKSSDLNDNPHAADILSMREGVSILKAKASTLLVVAEENENKVEYLLSLIHI